MDKRITNLNKTFIKSNCWNIKYSFSNCIAVFNVNQPVSLERAYNGSIHRLARNDYTVIFYINRLDGFLVDFKTGANYNKTTALNIVHSYRPGIGRTVGALYSSIILNFSTRMPLIETVRFFRPNCLDNEIDDDIRYMILKKYNARHSDVHKLNTDHNKKRFIVMPYKISIRTKPLSLIEEAIHFVTLIVDLDYKDEKENFTPFVYVYDSAHFLCYYYGLTGSIVLNKDDYFQFGQRIVVDDYVLNNDFNRCVCSCCAIGNLSSKIQCIVDCRCGYYCEASINLLLEDRTITSNNGILPDGTVLASGRATRNYLKNLLLNYKVQAELAIINPPFPQPF